MTDNIITEETMTGSNILTEATEGICWHKNNWTKSKEHGMNEVGVPEFLKVTLKRASNKTQHRGLYSSTSSEALEETKTRKNWQRKENFEGKSMHGSIGSAGSDFIDIIDFGDGLTQKLRTMSACSEDAVSVNIGTLADSTNCISDYGEGTRQKMERGSMKELDGVNNFSVEVGESNDGINHTLDFGEGTMEKSEAGHMKSASQGKAVSISNEAAEAAEDQAFDAALRSSSWMTRQQLESFVRIALHGGHKAEVLLPQRDDAIVQAVVEAHFEAIANEAAGSPDDALKDSISQTISEDPSTGLQRLVRRMNSNMKRIFVEKATATMSKEQMRNFVIESYEARERGSVSAAIETMNGSQIRDTLAEMTAAMNEIERREFAAESIPNLGREALERIFDRAAKSMTKEEFQSSLSRLEEEVEEVERKRRMEEKEMAERNRGMASATEKGEREVFAGGEKAEKGKRDQVWLAEKSAKNAVESQAFEAAQMEAADTRLAASVMREESAAMRAEMQSVTESRESFLRCAKSFKSECRAFQEETTAFKTQVALYQEESSSFRKSVEEFQVKTAVYRESEERLRQQLSAASCGRPDCVAEAEETQRRVRELTSELAEVRKELLEASARHVVATAESTVSKMEAMMKNETSLREEMRVMEKEEKMMMEKEEKMMMTKKSLKAEKIMKKEMEGRSIHQEAKQVKTMAMESSSASGAKEATGSGVRNPALTNKADTSPATVRRSSSSNSIDFSGGATIGINRTDMYHRKSRDALRENRESSSVMKQNAKVEKRSKVQSQVQQESQMQMVQSQVQRESQLQMMQQESQMQVRQSEVHEESKMMQSEMREESQMMQSEMRGESQMMQSEMREESQMMQSEMREESQMMQSEMYEESQMEKIQMHREEMRCMSAKSVSASSDENRSHNSFTMDTNAVEAYSAEENAMERRHMAANAMQMASIDYESSHEEASESSAFAQMESKSMMQTQESRSAISATQSSHHQVSSSQQEIGESMTMMTTADHQAEKIKSAGETSRVKQQRTEKKMTAARMELRQDGKDFCEENSMSRERTLSWQHSGDGSMGNREELRLKADAGHGEEEQDGDGICWHHINYKTAEEEKNQPEFLKARLKKTSFGVVDRRRKSSGSDTSSR